MLISNSRREFLRRVGLGAASLALGGKASAAAAEPAMAAESRPRADRGRPNIIIVMADDMGFSDLGCYGGEIKTPTIDRLAGQGLRFSQFYNCAVCGPSRASLMTGCYPWDVGQAPGASIFANLKKNCATVMQLLKAGVSYPSQFQGRNVIPPAGKSFVSVLRGTEGDQDANRVIAWPKAVRNGDWKLVLGKRPELYKISQDRNEKKNLAAEFPDRVLELKQIHAKTYSPR